MEDDYFRDGIAEDVITELSKEVSDEIGWEGHSQ
jgi:TolB-like protein